MLRVSPSLIATSAIVADDLLDGAAPLATRLRLLAAGPPRTRARGDPPLRQLQVGLERFTYVVHVPHGASVEATHVASERRDVLASLFRARMRAVVCAISPAGSAALVARRYRDSII